MSKSFRPYPTALLNPCADPTFKILFTSSNDLSQAALTEFLCDILGKSVTEVTLQPNELSGEAYDDKLSEFDINCKIDGEYANIEIQGQNQYLAYGRRAEYHVAHLLNHYTPKGMEWDELPNVYQISVLNFIFDKETKSAFNLYQFQNDEHRKVGECMNIIFLELPKIADLPDDIEKLTTVEMWGKFFLYAHQKEKHEFISALCDNVRGIKMANDVLSYISEDEANWIRETRYWTHVSDTLSARKSAIKTGHEEGFKQGHEQGFEQGMAEGRNQGIQQGIQKGIQQGIQQGTNSAKKEIAKKLLESGAISVQQISETTGLSIEEIETLQ